MVLELAGPRPLDVQWPELWTRGAISLATAASRLLEELDRQHADVVQLVQHAAGR